MDQDLSNSSKEELIKKITELKDDLKRTKKYGLVWDKEKNPEAVVEACKTKIPVLNEDTSKRIILGQNDNLLIEGDNFHSLTALNFILANSIDVIYIDPPYNTGHGDFIYNDNYVNADDGFRHSKWLSFMAKRLELARNLLTNRGAIYMSIDDREVFNLKLLCDSIFGEKNFICCFVKEGSGGKQDSVTYSVKHEYLLCYSKNAQAFIPNREKKHRDKKEFKFFDKAKNMYYKTQLLRKWGDQDRREDRPNLYYPLFINKKGLISTKEEENSQAYFPVNSLKQEGRWRWAKNSMQDNIDNGLVEYKKQNGEIIFYEKIFYDETDVLSKPFSTIISNVDKRGIEEISSIFGDKVFSYPKSVDYLKVPICTRGKNLDGS
ncbi:MAG: site-specific DNA-methyltransferase [Bacilli bacterium]|jgi:adenine-specific DNA-methyltransferase|nr:site-specific DNA-methyltransferase [Bacilli bacterium]MCI2055090.1 site-specific DNA-methyltransferase [Bacilli bacterium]